MNHGIKFLLMISLFLAGIYYSMSGSSAIAQTYSAYNQYVLLNTTTVLSNTYNVVEVNLTSGNSTVTLNTTVPKGYQVDVYIGGNAGATNTATLASSSGSVYGITSFATAYRHYRYVFDGTNYFGS